MMEENVSFWEEFSKLPVASRLLLVVALKEMEQFHLSIEQIQQMAGHSQEQLAAISQELLRLAEEEDKRT